MFRALDLANVSVYALNAAGLQTFAAVAAIAPWKDAGARADTDRTKQDNLRVAPENTGGTAPSPTPDVPETPGIAGLSPEQRVT